MLVWSREGNGGTEIDDAVPSARKAGTYRSYGGNKIDDAVPSARKAGRYWCEGGTEIDDAVARSEAETEKVGTMPSVREGDMYRSNVVTEIVDVPSARKAGTSGATSES